MAGTRFSVVVAAFNASATIAQTIRSVFQQTADDFELIIVDDGSTDDTVRRVRSLAEDRRVRVITQRNQGASVARNTGIAEASGSFISLLDADDIWLPSYLEEMGRALDAEPNAGFAYTDAWLMNDVNHKVRRTSTMFYEDPPDPPPQAPRDFFLRLLERNFVYNSVTVRRSIIEEVGGYDESLRTCEDYELWLRIAAHGIRGVRPPGLLAIYRSSPASLSGDMSRVIPDLCEVYRRYAHDSASDPEIKALADGRLAFWTEQLQLRQEPTVASRSRLAAFHTKRALMGPWLWLRQPPADVERTLRAVGEY